MKRLPRIPKPTLIVPLLVLVGVFASYKFVLSEPKAEAKPKVDGEVYVLPKEFLINLADDRFAKVSVALVLEGEHPLGEEKGGHGAATPPEGFGPLKEEALVRDLITDEITNSRADALIDRAGRQRLKRQIAAAIEKRTDVHVGDVLFTDVAVQ